MNYPILIATVDEERPEFLVCTIGGKEYLLPKSAIKPVIDGVRCTDGKGPIVGECDVKAEIPMGLAQRLGIAPRSQASLPVQNCRSCNARIVWAKTVNNKSVPVDADPVEFGGNMVLRNGVAIVLKKGEASEAGEKRYVSHFATCAQAKQHRKGK